MSAFTEAMAAFVSAERDLHEAENALAAEEAGSYTTGALLAHSDCDRALAQSGDSLESEVRRMIREERRKVHNVGPSD